MTSLSLYLIKYDNLIKLMKGEVSMKDNFYCKTVIGYIVGNTQMIIANKSRKMNLVG